MNRPGAKATILLLLITLVLSRALAGDSGGEAVPIRKPLAGFPAALDGGRWRGVDAAMDLEVAAEVAADDELSRYYLDGQGRTIWLHVAWFGKPSVQRLHIPKNCYPAHGWRELDAAREDIQGMDGRRFVFAKDIRKRLVFYTIVFDGGSTSDEYRLRLARAWRNIAGSGPDGVATVQVSLALAGDEDAATAQGIVDDFLRAAGPELAEHLPF